MEHTDPRSTDNRSLRENARPSAKSTLATSVLEGLLVQLQRSFGGRLTILVTTQR